MMFDEHVRFEYLGDVPSKDAPIISIVVFSTIFHCLFFYLLPSSLKPLMKSYIISTFHAVISILSVGNFFAHYSVNFKQINRIGGGGLYGTGDEIMVYTVCYSLGYFLYDTLLMLYDKSIRTTGAMIHHLIVFTGMFSGVLNGICHPAHFYLLGEELSTIPLNLKTIYHNKPRLHQIFTYLFVLTFFVSRLIYGSIICAYAFRSAPLFIRLAYSIGDIVSIIIGLSQATLCILTRILNVYWAILIIIKLFHLKKSKKNIS